MLTDFNKSAVDYNINLGEERSAEYQSVFAKISALMKLKQTDFKNAHAEFLYLGMRDNLINLARKDWDLPKSDIISYYFGAHADVVTATIWEHHKNDALNEQTFSDINKSLTEGAKYLTKTLLLLKGLHPASPSTPTPAAQ